MFSNKRFPYGMRFGLREYCSLWYHIKIVQFQYWLMLGHTLYIHVFRSYRPRFLKNIIVFSLLHLMLSHQKSKKITGNKYSLVIRLYIQADVQAQTHIHTFNQCNTLLHIKFRK
jgi:hypothetical protein